MNFKSLLLAVCLGCFSLVGWAQDTVVYHISDSDSQALGALRSIRNHLDTEPGTKITVVTLGQGVDFLMDGAKDRNGVTYGSTVSALVSRGVRFEVCEITLKNRDLDKGKFILEAEYTPSGVVRLSKLQHQGYAYIRP
jgi:uncharacterized protein